ncbi:unnamed protein product [Ilex paraguariensis]|uniref:Uncharacterized protein n=1 Tax=Ilex paraguariensis TaxID=185542 RepID=A0ABC8SHW6_9AQUA
MAQRQHAAAINTTAHSSGSPSSAQLLSASRPKPNHFLSNLVTSSAMAHGSTIPINLTLLPTPLSFLCHGSAAARSGD